MLRGGQPCAEYAQRDDEAEYQRHFAKCEETPADVQAVGFENRVHQRPYFGQKPSRQAQADGGGENALPHCLIKERTADEGSGRTQKLGDFQLFLAAEDLQADGVVCHQDKGHAQSQRAEPQNLADKFVNTIKGLYP